MIDIDKLDRVRVVENDFDSKSGTSVTSDILKAQGKSILPLQTVIGFQFTQIHQFPEIHGKDQNILIVGGQSDLDYVNSMAHILGYIVAWKYSPAHSIDKIVNVILLHDIIDSLIGTKFNIVVLTDFLPTKKGTYENIRKELEKHSDSASIRKLITFEDILGKECNIEDMFSRKLYLRMVNHAYNELLDSSKIPVISQMKNPRIVDRLDDHFKKEKFEESFSNRKVAKAFKSMKLSKEQTDDTTIQHFSKLFNMLYSSFKIPSPPKKVE